SGALWRLSLPIMFAAVSEIVLHVTNTIFLARVGVTELAAIAVADSIWQLFLVAPLGLVDGIQILRSAHGPRPAVGRGRRVTPGSAARGAGGDRARRHPRRRVAVARARPRELARDRGGHRGVPRGRELVHPAHRGELRL